LKSIIQFISLIRWPNLFLLGLNLYLVRIFLIGPPNIFLSVFLEKEFILILSSIVLITAAGYIINDYYDIKIDLINKPNRVIVGRQFSRRIVLLIYFLLNIIALTLALSISKLVFLTFTFCVFLLWYYSNSLKRKPFIGNFIVSLLTAFSLIVMALFYHKNQLIICIYAYFAFSMTLIREVIKDIEDVKGDIRHGCETLPIVWGIRKTKISIEVFSFIFALSFLFISYYFKIYFGWYWIIFLGVFLLFIYRLIIADTQIEFRQISTILKMIMLAGILSMTII
jgi:4-hydroxybenzoate polyprenyltransferase